MCFKIYSSSSSKKFLYFFFFKLIPFICSTCVSSCLKFIFFICSKLCAILFNIYFLHLFKNSASFHFLIYYLHLLIIVSSFLFKNCFLHFFYLYFLFSEFLFSFWKLHLISFAVMSSFLLCYGVLVFTHCSVGSYVSLLRCLFYNVVPIDMNYSNKTDIYIDSSCSGVTVKVGFSVSFNGLIRNAPLSVWVL